MLLAAVEDAEAHGVTWSALSCSPSHVTVRGVKDVAVKGDTVMGTVEVTADRSDSDEPRLHVSPSSDGLDRPGPGAPISEEASIDDQCPPWAATAFTSLQL